MESPAIQAGTPTGINIETTISNLSSRVSTCADRLYNVKGRTNNILERLNGPFPPSTQQEETSEALPGELGTLDSNIRQVENVTSELERLLEVAERL